MKKPISILMVLVLTLTLCAAPLGALAAQPISITSVNVNDDASVSITWDNPNGGKVTVGSLILDDGTAGHRINAEFDVSGSSYTYRNLALRRVPPAAGSGNPHRHALRHHGKR